MSDLFADIRPFNDNEVNQVLNRLLSSPNVVNALVGQKLSSLGMSKALVSAFTPLMRPFFRWFLARQLGSVDTVEEFQLWLEPLLGRLLAKTASAVEVRGLDQLDADQAYLWISNHRDIAMDPAMINYALHQANWPTSRIAIGDNLLKNPDVADIMRLNKSFIVKRSVENKREKLKELQNLSRYIRHSLDANHSIWIAQREGRSKDGIDKTDTAVLKMLALNGRENKESFAETFAAMRPVPVSIQYEWDPCDVLKAQELVVREQTGDYQKDHDEDVKSILSGLLGNKGRIIVSFGQPLTASECEDADTMAQAIDQQIDNMADVLAVNKAAAELLRQQADSDDADVAAAKAQLQARLAGYSHDIRQRILLSYSANLSPRA